MGGGQHGGDCDCDYDYDDTTTTAVVVATNFWAWSGRPTATATANATATATPNPQPLTPNPSLLPLGASCLGALEAPRHWLLRRRAPRGVHDAYRGAAIPAPASSHDTSLASTSLAIAAAEALNAFVAVRIRSHPPPCDRFCEPACTQNPPPSVTPGLATETLCTPPSQMPTSGSVSSLAARLPATRTHPKLTASRNSPPLYWFQSPCPRLQRVAPLS